MSTRKDLKVEAAAAAAELAEARRVRRAELAAMSSQERKAARKADRQQAKRESEARAKRRRAARKSMTRSERRADKRRDRVFRKVANRRRRTVGWTIAGLAIVGVAVLAAPYVSDIMKLLRIDVDSNTEAGADARTYGLAVAEQIADEGIVLLKNQDQLLPLQQTRINVFGFASFNLRYGGGGSGGADQSQALSLYEAFERQGLEYNRSLYEAHVASGASAGQRNASGLVQVVSSMIMPGGEDEIAPDYLTDDVLREALAFSETALVVVGNDGVEAQDFTPDQLRITENQRALLDVVTSTFDNVTVVVNSGNQMELGFLDEYPQIKSALWIGTPGPRGAVALARTLQGDNNPSGRLTGTYAYDVESAPAAQNFGNFKYENASRGFINYEEGIYVGYRYYETRFADEDVYNQIVQFPFGFGLSYTSFDWLASEPVIDSESVSMTVQVTNTGDSPGKDVVELFYSAPYNADGLEKSSTNLAAYAKTSLLEPGASETLTLSFPIRDMASWDTAAGGGYRLDAGEYSLHLARDAHTSVETYDFRVPETEFFDKDEVTGTDLLNQFDYASGDLTYLSRSDWDGTYPNPEARNYVASDELIDQMQTLSTRLRAGTAETPVGEIPTYAASNGILLEDMKGLEFDDPKWDEFLDQFTSAELVELFARGAYSTHPIPRLGIPSATLLDGPAGLNSFFSKITAASFPTAVVVASTWNDALAYALGEAIGLEARAYGVQGWYAPGMNIQRTAMGGRNFEYYSEDPFLSGTIAASMVAGAQDQGVLTFMKHFALNEQEANARSGVNVFVDEQAFREIYLRPFEITVKQGGANGAMSSFIHVGPKWSGGNPELLQQVLREEWGFQGVVSTDAVLGSFMDPAQAAVSGNELMLSPLGSAMVRSTFRALGNDPVALGNGLRDRAHQITYSLLQTDLFD